MALYYRYNRNAENSAAVEFYCSSCKTVHFALNEEALVLPQIPPNCPKCGEHRDECGSRQGFEMPNDLRAELGRFALHSFAHHAEGGDYDDREGMAIDLLANLLHYLCGDDEIAADSLLSTARRHWLREADEESDEEF